MNTSQRMTLAEALESVADEHHYATTRVGDLAFGVALREDDTAIWVVTKNGVNLEAGGMLPSLFALGQESDWPVDEPVWQTDSESVDGLDFGLLFDLVEFASDLEELE